MCNVPYENFMLFDFDNVNREELSEITYLGKFMLILKIGE
jgi:hypothetical protein